MGLLPASYAAGSSGHLAHHAQLAKKLNDLPCLVNDFGADPTGSSAADTAITNWLGSGEAELKAPEGIFKVTSTVTVADTATRLLGAGMVPGNASNGTVFRWAGAAGGTMFEVKNTSSSPYGVGFENMTLAGELSTGDAVDKASTAIAFRAGYGHYMRNVNLWRFKGSATKGILTFGPDSGGSTTNTGTIQNFRSDNLFLTAYGNDNAVGILVNNTASENLSFFQTYIASGQNSSGQGNGAMLHTIWIKAGQASFYGLITDCDARTASDDYSVLVDGGSIGIFDWGCEDPQPIRFSASAHSRGSVIHRFDWRSLDVGSGKYALDYSGPASGTEPVVLMGGVCQRKAGASNTPNLRVNNGVLIAAGVQMTSADVGAVGSFSATSTGYLVDLGGTTPTFHNGLLFGNAKVLQSKTNGGTVVDIAQVTSSDNLIVGDTTDIGDALVRAGTGSVKLQASSTTKVEANSTGVGFNAVTPVGKRTLGSAATDAATTQTLANNLRQALIDLGLGQT